LLLGYTREYQIVLPPEPLDISAKTHDVLESSEALSLWRSLLEDYLAERLGEL